MPRPNETWQLERTPAGSGNNVTISVPKIVSLEPSTVGNCFVFVGESHLRYEVVAEYVTLAADLETYWAARTNVDPDEVIQLFPFVPTKEQLEDRTKRDETFTQRMDLLVQEIADRSATRTP